MNSDAVFDCLVLGLGPAGSSFLRLAPPSLRLAALSGTGQLGRPPFFLGLLFFLGRSIAQFVFLHGRRGVGIEGRIFPNGAQQACLVDPQTQHHTGGQPRRRPQGGPAEQRDHLGPFLLDPDAVHHALGKARRGGQLLQGGEGVMDSGQLLPQRPAGGALLQMFPQLPLLLPAQLPVQPGGEQRKKPLT